MAEASLLTPLQTLANDLRLRWTASLPPLSASLARYEAAWKEGFQGRWEHLSSSSAKRIIHCAEPILLGDFHYDPRSRRALARLSSWLNRADPRGLLLEGFPAGWEVPPEARLDRSRLRRAAVLPIDRPYLDALLHAHALGFHLAGAWVDGSAVIRDAAAAAVYRGLASRDPYRRWILFFGDWHLAPSHLPTHLRAQGARPLILHQSPAPLWIPPTAGTELWLSNRADELVWTHATPLGRLVAHQLELATPGYPRLELEEELIDDIAAGLSDALALPPPQGRTVVWPSTAWDAYWATLPSLYREAFTPERPPLRAIFHPHRAEVWFPSVPTGNDLAEAAAHQLLLESLGWEAGQPEMATGAQVWRRLWATHLNPYLRPATVVSTAARLFPRPDSTIERRAAAFLSSPERHPPATAEELLLFSELAGDRIACALAHGGPPTPGFASALVENPGMGIAWRAILPTLNAA